MPQTPEERAEILARGRAALKARRDAAKDEPKVSLADVLGAITTLSESVNALQARVVAVEERPAAVADGSQFVPMRAPSQPYQEVPDPPTPSTAWAGLDGSEGNSSRSGSVPQSFMAVVGVPATAFPKYRMGQRVKLREEVHHGTADSKRVPALEPDGSRAYDEDGRPMWTREMIPLTWGEVLAKRPTLRCQVKRGGGRGARACGTPFRANEVCPGCGNGPATVEKLLWQQNDGWWKYKIRVPGLASNDERLLDVLEYELEAVL